MLGASRRLPNGMAALAIAAMCASCAWETPEAEAMTAPPAPSRYVAAADGYVLPLRLWPAEGKARAVVVAAHGMNDYGNAFAGAGEQWARHGIATYAYDQRGFGATEGRGRWWGAETLASDMALIARLARRENPGVPLYLMGHSMGAAVAVLAAGRIDLPRPAGVILSAPAVWPEADGAHLLRAALAFGAGLAPGMELPPRRALPASTDLPEVLADMRADPLVLHRTRMDTMLGIVDMMALARERAGRVQAPVLVQMGDDDAQVPRAGVAQLLDRLPQEETTLALYENGRHLLMRSSIADTVIADAAQWMTASPLSSYADARGARCRAIILDPAAPCDVQIVMAGTPADEVR